MVAVRRVDDPLVLTRRMLAKVAVVEGCWVWQGTTAKGYGIAWAGRMSPAGNYQPEPAHRIVYRLLVGPIPDDMHLDHLCLNKLCVNPAHVEPVTAAENVGRYFRAITHCKSGRPFDAANTHIRTNGRRACRACGRESQRRTAARRVAA
jgi:hypothetical protein